MNNLVFRKEHNGEKRMAACNYTTKKLTVYKDILKLLRKMK